MVIHRVFLVPGFFGFSSAGELKYWSHAHAVLTRLFDEAGLEVTLHDAVTPPTASLRRRAGRLAEHIAEHSEPGDHVHLVGHSTGGLDARLVTAPGVTLTGDVPAEAVVDRVRSVVGIATPNYGTPAAALFTSVMGQRILQLLSLSTVLTIRLGGMPLPALIALTAAVSGVGPRTSGGALDRVYRQVLHDIEPDRRHALKAYFAEVASDQSLLVQLTPESMDVFNAGVLAGSGVCYGSVLSRARKAASAEMLSIGLNPLAQANYALYRALSQLSASHPERFLPVLDQVTRDNIDRAFGQTVEARSNDAIVPTLSQVWGTVVHAAWGDHLDVIGHYSGAEPGPLHVDWLNSGSRFTDERFVAMWSDVVSFMLSAT